MKILHTQCLKIGRSNRNSRCPRKPYDNSLLFSLSLLVKSLEEEIEPSRDRVDTTRG